LKELGVHKGLLQGTLLLTISALLAKIMSVVYRIPYQNITGDMGFYVYQQVYPFFGAAFIVAIYGFPVIISKLTAESIDDDIRTAAILRFAFLSLTVVSISAFFILFFGSRAIAALMGDLSLALPLKAVSFSYLLIPFISVIRGYFQGRSEMVPTAVSQVADQFIRVTVILIVSVVLVAVGRDLYVIGAGAMLGGFVGGLASVTVLFYFLLKKGQFGHFRKGAGTPQMALSWTKKLLIDGAAICLSSIMIILFQMVEAFQMVSLLTGYGYQDEAAKLVKGVFDRGQPLLQLGAVLATSFSLTLVPIISGAHKKKNHEEIVMLTRTALKLTIVIGGAAAAGLSVIIVPTNIMLFQNAEGSVALGILGISILFSSLSITSGAVLQGLGKMYAPVIHLLVGLIVKVAINSVLVPLYGISGAAIASVTGFAVITLLNGILLQKLTGVLTSQRFQTGKIAYALLWMVVATFVWKELCFYGFPSHEEDRWFASSVALSSVFIGAFFYFFGLIRQKVWTEAELMYLPQRGWLLGLARKQKEWKKWQKQ
jgi:PST family polysaccharide transporter